MEETNRILLEILAELKKLNENKRGRQATRKAEHDAAQDYGFDEFWSIYPRKVGKMAAQKAYLKALHLGTKQEIYDGLKRFVEVLKRNPKEEDLIPHASTWLNAGRWTDEDIKPLAQKQQGPMLDSKAEDEKEKERNLADEWTDKKLAELPKQETDMVKVEVMKKYKEAIAIKPMMGRILFRAEIRKRYGCPYSR